MNYTTKLGTLVIEVPRALEIHRRMPVLVAPSGQHITQEHMEGSVARRAGTTHRSIVKVVIVELRDWQERHFGTRAG